MFREGSRDDAALVKEGLFDNELVMILARILY